MRRGGRLVVALLSGLLWGAGTVVLVNMYGITTLSPEVVYGITGAAILVSAVWSIRPRRHRAQYAVMLVLLLPVVVAAQDHECAVGVEPPGALLNESSSDDPIVIDSDDEDPITVFVWTSPPVRSAYAEIWLEIAGARVVLRDGDISGEMFEQTFRPSELTTPFGVLPGLHHVGGSIEDRCEVDGYVRVLGNPLLNPVGQAAAAAVLIGLAGTWGAGRSPRRIPGGRPRMEPEPPATAAEPPPATEPPAEPPAGRPPPTHAEPPHRAEPPDEAPAGEEPPAEPPAAVPESRWLQARIFTNGPGNAPLPHFRPNTTHDIEVRIGPEELGWLTGTSPFPDDRLPGGGPHRLTVLLTEPHLLRVPQSARIVLPERGASTSAWFELTTKHDTASVEARLTVLYGNRVLHTARLPSRVSYAPTAVDEGLTVENVAMVETVVQGIAGLATAAPFDATFIVNHDAQGTGRVTAFADGATRQVNLSDDTISKAIRLVTKRLGEIVDQPADFEGVDTPGTIELLVFLARHGSMLRHSLVAEFLDTLAGAGRLQVVSAQEDAFFPFEFAYDFESPHADEVTLCPTGVQMLSNPVLEETCPGPHGATVVCPLGFWGLSKTIERRTFQKHSTLNPRFLVASQPSDGRDRISLGAGAVFAASDRVDGFVAGSIARVAGTMAAASGGHALRADSWQEWEADVVARDPSLLMLLPHTVFDDSYELYGIEIGDHDRRLTDQITERLVPRRQPVIVALLGCATAVSGPVGYETFPSRFQLVGAEIVVGTITEVLGRHAAPIAERLVTGLHESVAEGAVTVGEVMTVLRRRLLGEGIPAILAVVAFGDASWQIGA